MMDDLDSFTNGCDKAAVMVMECFSPLGISSSLRLGLLSLGRLSPAAGGDAGPGRAGPVLENAVIETT